MKTMTNITINNKKNAIEISKNFEKKASVFGSREYKMLQKARRDYPDFRVVTKTAAKRNKDTYKGLTYSLMEKYISAHDEDGSIMKEFNNMRGVGEEAEAMMAEAITYGEMKAWFLDKFPEIEEFQAKREAILKGVEARRNAKRNEAA